MVDYSETYSKDILSADVIKNLSVASDVDNDYHKLYVERLKQVNNLQLTTTTTTIIRNKMTRRTCLASSHKKAQLIKENRVQECAMLEKHILEARAKALAYEEREMERQKQIMSNSDIYSMPTGNTSSVIDYPRPTIVMMKWNFF